MRGEISGSVVQRNVSDALVHELGHDIRVAVRVDHLDETAFPLEFHQLVDDHHPLGSEPELSHSDEPGSVRGAALGTVDFLQAVDDRVVGPQVGLKRERVERFRPSSPDVTWSVK